MGKPKAYDIGEDTGPSPISLDNARREARKGSISGPELLSIVRIGDGDLHWVVTSVAPDRRSVSVAPLKQGDKVEMMHDVPVTELWPYYAQLDKSERSESA